MIFKDVIFLRADGEPDSRGEYFSMDSKIEVPEELPILSHPDKELMVGWARNIRRIDSLFIADFHLFDEVLPVEITRHLVPSIAGSTKLRENKALKDIKITRLDLTPWNADKRLKTLVNYSFSVEGTVKK